MAQPTWDQDDCAFYNDGTEAGSTLISGSNIVVGNGGGADKAFDTTILFRAVMQLTTKNDDTTFDLLVDKDGGGYDTRANITGITAVDSANLTAGDDTTQRLGGGTFISDNNGVGDNTTAGGTTQTLNQELEVLFAFEIDEADVNNGEVFSFRVYVDGGATAANTYTETLTVTVSKVTLYTQSNAGSETPTGALTKKKTSKDLAGSETDTGTVDTVKSSFISLTGSETPTGALTKKKTSKAVAGSETDTGDITLKKTKKALAGSETDTGDITLKKTKKSLAGSETDTGTVATQSRFTKALAGSETPTGDLTKKKTSKSLTGAETDTGDVTTRRPLSHLSLAGSETPTGALTKKKTSKTLAGSETDTGAVSTTSRFTKSLAGSQTDTGDIAKKTAKAFAGSETDTGNVIKKAIKALAGSETPSGTLVKKAIKLLVGAVTDTGELVKKTIKSFAGSETDTGTVATVKNPGSGTLYFQSNAGAETPSGTLSIKTKKTLAGSETPSGDVTKKTSITIAGSATDTGAVTTVHTPGGGTSYTQSLAGVEIPTGSIRVVHASYYFDTPTYSLNEWTFDDFLRNPEKYLNTPGRRKRVYRRDISG